MRKAFLILTATLIPSIPLSAQARPARQAPPPAAVKATKGATVEGITEYSLPNGLRVLLFPDPSKPTVTVNITYLVGSKHEGYGEGGMAHLLEHFQLKGTPRHKNIAQEYSDHGSRPNCSTWFERTNCFETVPATDANLDWALDLEADRLTNTFLTKKDLETEFSVVRNEFENRENNPFIVTFERTMAAAYRFHAYGRPPIGNKADIENVPIERLQVFYKRYYQPDNAVLVVAGKFDPEKTLATIEKKFGAIPRPKRSLEAGNLLFASYTAEPAQDGERYVTIRRVGDAQVLMAGYHTPPGAHPDFAAVDVLADVLGNVPSGRLYKALVDAKLATDVGVFSQQYHDPNVLILFAQLRKEQSLDSARTAFTRALDAAATSSFTTEEVERAKTKLLKDIELSLNNSEQIALELSEWTALGDWRMLFVHRDRIRKVTPADVQRVAAAYLRPSNRTIAAYIPTDNPDRAEIPAPPNVAPIVAEYKGSAVVQTGEAFDASPANIDARTLHRALPNGMQLTLLPKQTRGGRVVAQLVVRYGSEQTLTNKISTSTLMALLLGRGTAALTYEQVKDSLDKLKAQSTINPIGTGFQINVETVRGTVVPVLDLLAQSLRAPRLDSTEFEKLKQQQIGRVESQKSEPQVVAGVQLLRRLVPKPKGHPLYVTTPEESVEDLKAVTLEQVRQFYRDFVGASSADLAVIGDFDADALAGAAGRLFGDWKSPQPYVRITRAFPPVDSASLVIETPDKANAAYFGGQNLALRDDDPDYPAMVIGNYIIGGGLLNSRLITRLRVKEGISYFVTSQLQAQSLDRSTVFLAVAIYAPQNVDRLVAAIREEMDRVRAEGFTAEEVEAAKSGYLQARTQSRANDNELVGTLVNRRFAGRTMAYDADFERKVQALTPAQVNAAVRKYLDAAHYVSVRAGDFAKHPPVKSTP